MTTDTNPMKTLRKRLSEIGIKKSYLDEAILPDWWDDEIALVPSGYSQGLLYLSRRLGLSQRFLIGDSGLEFLNVGDTKFKKQVGVEDGELRFAQSIAVSAARTAILGVTKSYSLNYESSLDIRKYILEKGKIVNLTSLLDFCWRSGIPVLHVSNFPRVGKKMDGLCLMVGDRPVIVVSKNSKFPAWLVFIIAHELGHIFEGHIKDDSVLVDQDIGTFDVDGEEQQANAFASTVLSGRQNFSVTGPEKIRGEHLAKSAMSFGKKHNIDPGVVLLNYAWTMKNFACANMALGIVEDGQQPAKLIHKKMLEHIDRNEIPDESFEWLLRVTKAEEHA